MQGLRFAEDLGQGANLMKERNGWLEILFGKFFAGKLISLAVNDKADYEQQRHADKSYCENAIIATEVFGDESPDVGSACAAKAKRHSDI